MKLPQEPFTYRRRVAFGDCDPARIYYAPRAVDYAVEAVEAWHESVLGVSWTEWIEGHRLAAGVTGGGRGHFLPRPPPLGPPGTDRGVPDAMRRERRRPGPGSANGGNPGLSRAGTGGAGPPAAEAGIRRGAVHPNPAGTLRRVRPLREDLSAEGLRVRGRGRRRMVRGGGGGVVAHADRRPRAGGPVGVGRLRFPGPHGSGAGDPGDGPGDPVGQVEHRLFGRGGGRRGGSMLRGGDGGLPPRPGG